MKSKRGQIFTTEPLNRPRSNTFDLSHERKFSCDMGELVPVMVMDCVPGDSIYIKPAAMTRLAPMIAPTMHRINQYIHYFFVPNRIIWEDFEKFITGGEDGLDETVWAHFPYQPDLYQAGTIADYLGLPIATDQVSGSGATVNISTLPFAAYNKIWNNYYRDQNLMAEVIDTVPSGAMSIPDFLTMAQLKNRSWQHDYFTSALPWTQKGPEAMLPLGQDAPLIYNKDGNHNKVEAWIGTTSSAIPPSLSSNIAMDATNFNQVNSVTDDSEISLDVSASHVADLSNATASSINDLRRAFKLQEWLEKNARGGSRYNESILIHFGVHTGDARLNRPEYIGGIKAPIKISEVLQTSETDQASTPQGNMAGHGIGLTGSQGFKYNVKEHGYIIGIMSVMPESSYQQGIPKHFQRSDKFDYYWPSFAHIGEQAISNTEIAISGNSSYNKGIFGYTPRYAEYKYMSNTVHGEFKTTLNFWHAGRIFGAEPNLNEGFLQMKQFEVDRIFAVENRDVKKLWITVHNGIKARRPMPVYGTPKIA